MNCNFCTKNHEKACSVLLGKPLKEDLKKVEIGMLFKPISILNNHDVTLCTLTCVIGLELVYYDHHVPVTILM